MENPKILTSKRHVQIFKYLNILALIFTIGYIGYYYYICWTNAKNYPLGDDIYQTTLWFHQIYQLTDPMDQLMHYFYQYNAHFLLAHYIAITIDYNIFGEINYQHLIFIGNVLFFGSWLLFYFLLREQQRPTILLMLPVTLVMFTPINYMIDWAATAIHNGAMLTFGILSLLAFTKQKIAWMIFSLCCLFLSMFSLIGGLVVPIAGALMFTVLPDKKFSYLFTWIFASGLFYGWFFHLWGNAGLGMHDHDIFNGVMWFFAFLGSSVSLKAHYMTMAPTIGLLSFLYLFYIYIKTDFFSKHPVLFGSILFILGIAGMNALGRNNFDYSISGRSKYYWMQAVYIASFYIVAIKQPILKANWRQFSCLVGLLILLSPVVIKRYNANIPRIVAGKEILRKELENFNVELTGEEFGYGSKLIVRKALKRGIKEGYYALPVIEKSEEE